MNWFFFGDSFEWFLYVFVMFFIVFYIFEVDFYEDKNGVVFFIVEIFFFIFGRDVEIVVVVFYNVVVVYL